MGPWDPNWRPDPSGRRLLVYRAARWGALFASLIFAPLVVVATLAAPQASDELPDAQLAAGVVIAMFSLPGLALLGAGLTPSALGSRTAAASAGLAIGVGVPVAALASAMIGAFIIGEMAGGPGEGSVVAGQFLRAGVTAAVRISPLIALGSVGWVLLVRWFGRQAVAVAESAPSDPGSVSPGRGPRPPGG